MDEIEAELFRAGANRKDYVFTSFEGRMVAERDSIFDQHQRDPEGRTNIERMQQNRPPLDREGKEVVLHHANQKDEGPIVELTRSEHEAIPISRAPSVINRPEFRTFRETYWQARAARLLRR